MTRPIPDDFALYLQCDPETGVITRRIARHTAPAGKVIRVKIRTKRCGYQFGEIKIAKKDWLAHRVVWFLCTGQQPPAIIDHINCNALDNRLANLRPATAHQNVGNCRRFRGKDTPKGVRTTQSGKYAAGIAIGKRRVHLGTFETVDLAQQAYMRAATEYFGEFARAS